MARTKKSQTSTNIRPRIAAALLWISSIQYFIAQVVVASAWPRPYSIMNNFISSLGNTACGTYDHQFVCSPLHALMNWSFVVQGATMLAGALLFAYIYRQHKLARFGFFCLALGGVGSIIVGLVPENTNLDLHSLGALMPFFVGNIGVIAVGLMFKSRPMRIYTISSGVIALMALGLFLSEYYLGLGVGGMERVVDYTQTIWMIVFGIFTLRNLGRSSK